MATKQNPIPQIGTRARINLDARVGRSRDFLRFTPRRAVKELLRETPTTLFSRAWAAIALIVWACLDGRARRDEDGDRTLIYSNDARRAGNLFLLYELDRLSADPTTKASNRYAEAMRTFELTEGFANAIDGQWAGYLLELCAESHLKNRLLLAMARYLILSSALPKKYQTKTAAKTFVSENVSLSVSDTPVKRRSGRRGANSLGDYWFEYQRAAPYLFALYSDPEFRVEIFGELKSAIDWVKAFADDRTRVTRFLGSARSFAEQFQVYADKVKLRDFNGVEKVDVELEPFTADELAKIFGDGSLIGPVDTRSKTSR